MLVTGPARPQLNPCPRPDGTVFYVRPRDTQEGYRGEATIVPRNVVVIGAVGGTGRDVVSRALAQGHDVTALVRDPERLPHARRSDHTPTSPRVEGAEVQ